MGSPDPFARARWFALMVAAGAALSAISLVFDLTPDDHRSVEIGLCALGFATAAVTWIMRARLTSGLMAGVMVPLVVLLVATGYVLSGDPANRGVVFYVAAMVYSGYFFEHRIAAAHLGLVAVTYGGALGTTGQTAAAIDSFLFTFPMAVITGAVVASLRDRLTLQAKQDWLTGAWNRRGFEAQLQRQLAGDGALALMVVDADDFKGLNDGGGHHAGDEALRAIAAALADVAGSPERVARVGGDEFAVLLPGLDEDGALLRGRALRARLRADGVPTTVSIGVATAPRDPEGLVRAADDALYTAKRAGRDRGVGASEAARVDAATRLAELASAGVVVTAQRD